MKDEYIVWAVPIFAVLLLVEIIFDRVKGLKLYRVEDSITNLSTGLLRQIGGVLTGAAPVIVYYGLHESFKLFDLRMDSVLAWVGAFLAYGFLDYWGHRITHRVNLFWGWHQVHHQSEDFNLSVALRQPAFPIFWPIFLPMALIGFPTQMFLIVGTIDLVHQFWIHTQVVPKLGWLEWFLNTPSNHRVHHGQNALYTDKNYGGLLIIWDRMFGTYQEELEDEAVVYGIDSPVRSWNPLWVNVNYYRDLWRDAVRTRSWWDKLRLWFMPTGWRPADVELLDPSSHVALADFRKFELRASPRAARYAITQFLIVGVCVVSFAFVAGGWPVALNLACAAGLGFWLFCIGRILEGRPSSKRWEAGRLMAMGTLALVIVVFAGTPLWWGVSGVVALYLVLSGFALIQLTVPARLSGIRPAH